MAVIATEIEGIGYPTATMYLINPVPGQMNTPEFMVTVAQFDKGGSSVSVYDIAGQMNIPDAVVTVTDVTLGSIPLLPLTSNMQNPLIVSYTTITNSVAGMIDQGIVKLFGDLPQREYWI